MGTHRRTRCGKKKVNWPANWLPGQTTHGKSRSRVYRAWRGMHQRCYNRRDPDYHNYGGRGILVMAPYHSFEAFYRDLGDPPPKYSLDRIDVRGHYAPNNLRWADVRTQRNNLRNSVHYQYKGEKFTIAGWAEKLNLPYHVIYKRIRHYNWDCAEALEEPVGKWNRRAA